MIKMKIFLKLLLISHLVFFTNCVLNRWTGMNDDGDGDLTYLDRHNVWCNNGSALAGFTFLRPYIGGIGIEYGCFKSESILDNSYNDVTPWTDASDNSSQKRNSVHRLSFIPIKCKNDYGLKAFHLESKCNIMCKVRYTFTCVALKTIDCTSADTGFKDVGDGETWKLDKFNIDQPNYNVISQWSLSYKEYFRYFNSNGKTFQINYTYCTLRNTEAEVLAYIANKPKNTNFNNNLRLLEEK